MDYEKEKKHLVELLEKQGITDKSVLSAVGKVPRHEFVPETLKPQAYGNYPLPIGKEQTISQPFTVAFMLQELELEKGSRVFEIGTGSGWNSALMSVIVGGKGKIFTTEVAEELIKTAKSNLKHYKNVKLLEIDGSSGYEKEAPYDRIVITAACPSLPDALVSQLADNGILIAPVGPQRQQDLIKIVKKEGAMTKEILGKFMFVPLKGEHGY